MNFGFFDSFTILILIFLPAVPIYFFVLLSKKHDSKSFIYFSFFSICCSFIAFLILPQDCGPDVFNVGGPFYNSYLINTGKNYIIVDTGYRFCFWFFSANLKILGVKYSDIKYIVITHANYQNIGFLPKLLELTNASIIMHTMTDQRLREGFKPMSGGCTHQIHAFLYKNIEKPAKIEVPENRLIRFDGHQIFYRNSIDINLLFLAGHTMDSIGLQLPDGRLICGDMATSTIFADHFHPYYIEDYQKLRKSWNYVIRANTKILLPAQGKPLCIDNIKDNIVYYFKRSLVPVN